MSRPVTNRRQWVAVIATISASLGLLSSCASASAGSFAAPRPLHAAPEPAVSPPVAAHPVGRIIQVGKEPEGIAAAADGTIAVAVRGTRGGIELLSGTGRERGFVPLPGEARHLELAGPDGPFLVPDETKDRLYEVSLDGHVVHAYSTGRQPHDAGAIGGVVAVANEFGNSITLIRPGGTSRTVPAPLQPGGLAAGADAFLVVGVRARVVAAYRPNGGLIARATSGAGPTHVVAGINGWFYVADTNGGRLLAYRLSGSSLKQENSIRVGSKPYGIAFDPSTNDVFVTLTGTNQLVGLRLDGPRVIARWTWATGRQPNSVAVDAHDREAVVAVTDSNAVEMIPLPARDPGPNQARASR